MLGPVAVPVPVFVPTEITARDSLLEFAFVPLFECVRYRSLCTTEHVDLHGVESVDCFSTEIPADEDVNAEAGNEIRR